LRDISHRMDYLRASSACILIADAGFEVDFSEGPEAFGGAEGEFHGFGCLGHRHADEVAELDQFGNLGVFFFEVGQGFVDGEEFVGGGFDNDLGFTEVFAVLEAGFLGGQFAAGFFDEDASHGLRSGGEEVGAVWPLAAGIVGQSDPSFVDQCSGLQGLVPAFACHFRSSDASEFIIDGWQQRFRGLEGVFFEHGMVPVFRFGVFEHISGSGIHLSFGGGFCF